LVISLEILGCIDKPADHDERALQFHDNRLCQMIEHEHSQGHGPAIVAATPGA
jgi:hypothetical protein